MEKQEKLMGRRELILFSVIALIAAIFFLVNQRFFSSPAAMVEISVIDENSQKQVLEVFSISEDREYTIHTGVDGINHLIIQNREARISEANCPNHDCVKKGAISKNGEMLVCIPHRLTVSILSK